jgi:hypothetical protein
VIDAFLIDKLTVLLLQQRCTRDRDGTVFYRPIRGRGAVRLNADEWASEEQLYRDLTRRSGRMLRWALWLTIPFGIMLMVIESNIPMLHAASGRLEAASPTAAMLLYTAAMPLSFMAWHCWKVIASGVSINARLSSRPRLMRVPKGEAVAFRAAQLLALVLLGPHLFLETAVTLDPQRFYYTPFRYYRLDWFGLASIIVLGTLAYYRVLGWWLNRGEARQEDAVEDAGRQLAIVERAKQSLPNPPA